jgi:hypothetical protein
MKSIRVGRTSVALTLLAIAALVLAGCQPYYVRWLHNDSDLALLAVSETPLYAWSAVPAHSFGMIDNGRGSGYTTTVKLFRADTCELIASAATDLDKAVFTLTPELHLSVESDSGDQRTPGYKHNFEATKPCPG